MSDLGGPWIGIKSFFSFIGLFINDMLLFRLIKKDNLFFSLNIENYFFLFFLLLSSFYLKIMSVIDLTAIHHIDNIGNEYELLYVNLFYKLNFRFFLKIFLKKEDLIVSNSHSYKSTAWFEREI